MPAALELDLLMASWRKTFAHLKRFAFAGQNQHGCRYKQTDSLKVSVCRMTVERTDITGLQQLILLSHHLDAPVRYDFTSDPQTAYIEVVSAERLDHL